MTACSYAVPVAGFLGVIAAFVILRLYRRGSLPEDFDAVQLPEFDQHGAFGMHGVAARDSDRAQRVGRAINPK